MSASSSYSQEIIKQFQSLQNQLRQQVSVDKLSLDDYDVLVIPSVTLDQQQLQKIPGVHLYEERLLFSLIRLRNPRIRLIYVTSQPIHPRVIDYYLHLIPGIQLPHARDRLLLFSTYDSSSQSLTEKILKRPRLIERIANVLRPKQSYMVCYNSTSFERELSVLLGIPLLAADPDLLHWGTKSGSRQIFAECNIPHADGSSLVFTGEDLVEVATDLWERKPQLKRLVVKLNEGFSGEGNALLDLPQIEELTRQKRLKTIRDRLPKLRFQAPDETWEKFQKRIADLGAIVEAFIEGEIKRSPSVQCLIHPNNTVEILSTHDQILGGPDGQIFEGCRFPADQAYRLRLQEMGQKVGENLAQKGALERFGLDFITVRRDDGENEAWEIYAIEINLRRGGTTHPFMTLKLLTNGHYDCSTGLFYSQQGKQKFYRASDNLQSQRYQGLLPDDLMDIVADHHLHFDSSTETGTVFHLMGCLSEFGKLGLTCIGNSPQQAQEIYHQVVEVLDQETEAVNPENQQPLLRITQSAAEVKEWECFSQNK
ncbi:peptide ligase PGM1-related protein [Limnoraphis robusta]|uniref:Peptide ligase PGM1-related protein n=1 Tax=Limnoraphis robusta CCNP1315 TaxID=3110306 RepID=A0ABU5U687_9CYAN|nr:peptide ligase PGM1-related protein [Limnoraphis robusta]MEA5522699.1 peptide ligase PGM1-related protein [Limnoraphis robusta CCNP1315]MEA5543843.1 peptide ligase PGM1-related protein [Limnoraphis robusta CCNP1324]